MGVFSYLFEYNRYCAVIGIGVILLIAFLFSKKRSAISGRLVVSALLLQGMIGFFVLRTTIGRICIEHVASGTAALYHAADEGIAFLFGNLVDVNMPWGFIFVVKVLPIIIFFGAFMSVLFHFGIVQRAVACVSWFIRPLLGTTGPETLCAIANSFLGQTEAPLLIRHYLRSMTKSEMLVVMVSGMATISGGILVVFIAMGVPATHLLASSVMSIPASILIAKILYPETDVPVQVRQQVSYTDDVQSSNVLDAISIGTSDGLQLALNVGAMLLSFLAMLALINYSFAAVTELINAILLHIGSSIVMPVLSVDAIFSYVLAPFGYLLGFTGKEALAAGQLIGTKVAVNEVIAYGKMVNMDLSERVTSILTYALCGFSNFSCIGIQIGGIGALVPERRGWLTELGLYAVLGGTLANMLSAMIAALLL